MKSGARKESEQGLTVLNRNFETKLGGAAFGEILMLIWRKLLGQNFWSAT
jgi:hypothetical protein